MVALKNRQFKKDDGDHSRMEQFAQKISPERLFLDEPPPAFEDVLPGIKISVDFSERLKNLTGVDVLRPEDKMVSLVMR